MDGYSKDIVKDDIEKLRKIFPQCVAEGKVKIDVLLNILGEYEEKDYEKYEFTWKGKNECYKVARERTKATLIPCEEESVNFNDTNNIYIEGDNLEVLKILQKSYYNKIKMIYIDPPYNTGNDFIYKDDFNDTLGNYKKTVSSINKSNPETSGRFHTNWLNMMFPRLMLAHSLLKDEGVIFISIDDNELHNLRKLCDEVFGENNFIGQIIRKTKTMTGDEKTGLNIQHDYVLIYSKNIDKVFLNGKEKDFKGYKNPDNDINGDWCSGDPSAKSGGEGTNFPIVNPYTNKVDYPPKGRYWAFSKHTLEQYIQKGKIVFKKQHKDNERGFIFKRYKNELKSKNNPLNTLFIENNFMNEFGSNDLKELFENEYFEYPKVKQLIKELINSCVIKDDIILDFFSGSATTGHAAMQLNAENAGGGGSLSTLWYSCLNCAMKKQKLIKQDTKTYVK